MIFNIQKCSIHDGDGLRTLVFFKGCSLRCPWCSNPESQSCAPDLMELPARCIGCGICQAVCPQSAVLSGSEGFRINRSLCTRCFQCADHCYAGSKRITGQHYSIDELYKEIEKDIMYYTRHGGGVTFSGSQKVSGRGDKCCGGELWLG